MTSFAALFHCSPEFRGRAPGRIEVLGNHVDYNGGNVLGAAIDRFITLELSRRNDRQIHLATGHSTDPVQLTLDQIEPQSGSASWVNYPLGVVSVMREQGLVIDRGFNLQITSDLPSGAGISSSAALEMATAVVLNRAYGGNYQTIDLVRAARRAENEFVGVPCGILDQGVVGFGQADQLVRIDCAKETFSTIPLPADTCFWIFNTQKKHALIDSFYSTRHQECMEARSLLATKIEGLQHLAAVTPGQWQSFGSTLPLPLRLRAQHIIEEQERVNQLIVALEKGRTWTEIGHLLTASHASSRDLFENSCAELDYLVDLLSPIPSVYGARLTGGGFGGAVLALTSPAFNLEQAQPVLANYERKFQHSLQIIPLAPGDGARVEEV